MNDRVEIIIRDSLARMDENHRQIAYLTEKAIYDAEKRGYRKGFIAGIALMSTIGVWIVCLIVSSIG